MKPFTQHTPHAEVQAFLGLSPDDFDSLMAIATEAFERAVKDGILRIHEKWMTIKRQVANSVIPICLEQSKDLHADDRKLKLAFLWKLERIHKGRSAWARKRKLAQQRTTNGAGNIASENEPAASLTVGNTEQPQRTREYSAHDSVPGHTISSESELVDLRFWITERLSADSTRVSQYLERAERLLENLSSRVLPITRYHRYLETLLRIGQRLNPPCADGGVSFVTNTAEAKRILEEEVESPYPIVISGCEKGSEFPDIDAYLRYLQKNFETITVSDFGMANDAFGNERWSVDSLRDRYNRRGPQQCLMACAELAESFCPPTISLDINCVEENARPACLDGDQFRVLRDIASNHTEPALPDKRRHSGKRGTSRFVDLLGCTSFSLLSEEDAITLAHHDRHALGTWVTMLLGVKLWIFWPEMTSDEWTEFEDQTIFFTGRRPSYVLLRPGDTIIMRPGHRLVHAVVSLENAYARGGMWLDKKDMKRTLQAIDAELQTEMVTTNEDVAMQLPEFIDALERQIHHPLNKADFNNLSDDRDMPGIFMSVRRYLTPCFCKPVKVGLRSKTSQGCPCLIEQEGRGRGCTWRCSKHCRAP